MRQQISRLVVGLFLVLFASQSIAAGSDKYQQYRKYLQTTEYDEVAMAMDADGRWAFYPSDMAVKAKLEALHVCRQHSTRPETCKIVDVSGLSVWWRAGAKGNPASSSYVPSSSTASSSIAGTLPAETIYCLDSRHQTTYSGSFSQCIGEDRQISEAEHRRLKSDSGNTASSLKKKLRELKSLVDEGLITEEEYGKAKKRILDKM